MTNSIDQYNDLIIDQINQTINSGLKNSLTAIVKPAISQSVVVRNQNNILVTIPESENPEPDNTEYGPGSFSDCIRYVNEKMIADANSDKNGD